MLGLKLNHVSKGGLGIATRNHDDFSSSLQLATYNSWNILFQDVRVKNIWINICVHSASVIFVNAINGKHSQGGIWECIFCINQQQGSYDIEIIYASIYFCLCAQNVSKRPEYQNNATQTKYFMGVSLIKCVIQQSATSKLLVMRLLLMTSMNAHPWWRHQMETYGPVPVNSPHKGQWHGALLFSLIYVWTNGWVNNRDAGDLRR